MKELAKQLGSNAGAVFAAACCAGASWALAALAGLWTSTVVLFAGLGLMIASSLWDFLSARARK